MVGEFYSIMLFIMKTLKFGILPLTIAMLLVGAGCASTATNANQNTNTQNINAARVESVPYAGQDGKNERSRSDRESRS
jgi:hypothetical protein